MGVPWCFDVCKQQVVVEKKRNGQLGHRGAPHQHVWTQVGPQPQPTQVEERGHPLYKNTHTVNSTKQRYTEREKWCGGAVVMRKVKHTRKSI